MTYMSKTKRRRVRRQRFLGLAIAAAVIAAIILIIWQASLGSVLAKVEGTSIREGQVSGVEAFLTYVQTGQFPSSTFEGTDEEIATQKDMMIVQRNSLVQNVFISYEVVKNHLEAQGVSFPTEEQLIQINENVEAYFGSNESVRLFESNGVKRNHIEFYFRYVALMTLFQEKVAEEMPVTEEESRAYYDENPDYFMSPLSMRASHILILDSEHTSEKRAEIEQILDRINNGEDFAELATQYSEDSSAESGGDLGTFGTGEMVTEFEEACLALEPGEVSGIVETPYGFHIIKLTEMNEPTMASFEESRESIESVLASERASEKLEALIDAANITYNGLITPSTGKPPTSLAELDEARGGSSDDSDSADDTAADDTATDDSAADDTATDDSAPDDTTDDTAINDEVADDHEGHDHD